jgi:poly-gamma-glutamate capsule biosynthesis protein CapA/YwtB (metallophosphatase superfamily)
MTLCFIGDIMDMRHNRLIIGADLKEFARPCNFLIGNFEATITVARKTRLAAQRQDPAILDALADFFPPSRTALSVANNHAGDFSADIWHRSIALMEQRGFQVFGLNRSICVDFMEQARIVAASQWSNLPAADMVSYESLDQYALPAALNIAYPHWGYELERFPRPETVREGICLAQHYDAVIGHHSHVPQLLMTRQIGANFKLIAFSLGDFCSGLNMKKYRYGIICKMEIGPGDDGVWKIGAVEWRYTEVTPIADKVLKVDRAGDVFV